MDVISKVSIAKRKDLQGKGNTPNCATCLTAEDEDGLCELGAFGSSDPAWVFDSWVGFAPSNGRSLKRPLCIS